jgi:methionyl-tRNA synthetase
MSARYTAELANGLGNLASRVTAMTNKYFEGVLPEAVSFGDAEKELAQVAARAAQAADAAVDSLSFSGAINATWELVDAVNGYLTIQEPWKVAKTMDTDQAARDSVATTLYAAAESLRILSVLLNPVMPKACASLWSQLGAEPALGSLASQRIQDCGRWGLLPAGSVLTKGDSLFPRLEDPEEFSS